MKWYYSANREKLGPIDAAAFDCLVAGGVIGPETLVWRQGLPGWRSFAEVRALPPPAPGNADSEAKGVTCRVCGAFLLLDSPGFDYTCPDCLEAGERAQEEHRVAEECDASDEETRREGLRHERRLRTVAGMYFFLGGALAFAAVIALARGRPGITLLCLLLGVPILLAARELMQLRRRAKLAAGCVSGLGLLVVGIGTLLHLYVLYLVCNKNGKRILSPEYRELIARTPHLKPGISWVGVVLFCILHILAFRVFG